MFYEVVRNGCCLVGVRQHADGRVPTLGLLADACLVIVIQAETPVVQCAR